LKRWIGYLAGAVILGATAAYFSSVTSGHWAELLQWRERFQPLPFFVAVSLLILYHSFLAWLFGRWLGLLGGSLAWARSFKVIYISQMARFLPGGIWGYAGQVYLGAQQGVPASTVMIASGAHALLNVITGIILALLLIPKAGMMGTTWNLAPVLLMGTAAAAVLLPGGVRFFQRRLCAGSTRTEGDGRIGFRSLCGLSLLYSLHWVLYGLAFWFYLRSLDVASQLSFGSALGALAGAGVMGLIVPFVPGGLGVREGTLAFLLQPALAAPDAAFVSLFSRVWLLFADLICFGIALCLNPRHRR